MRQGHDTATARQARRLQGGARGGAGACGPEAVAEGLTRLAVPAPSSGRTDWTADSVAKELAALNADLDKAYRENGFGA